MRIGFTERRGSILSQHGALPCLRDTPCINVTRGCALQCCYCPLRAGAAPGRPDVVVYANLAEKLEEELAAMRHRPTAAYFSPSCDPLQPSRPVLAAAYGAMKTLLERGVGVVFSTAAEIPPAFLRLFETHAPLVQARITLTTSVRAIQRTIEPGAARPAARLENIRRLQAAGVDVEARLEPLIPALTDIDLNLRKLFEDLAPFAPLRGPMSYLFLRGHSESNMRQTFGRGAAFHRVLSYYDLGYRVRLDDAQSDIRVLPPAYRKEKYEHIREMAREFGLSLYVCGCKNPDLSRQQLCRASRETHFARAEGQGLLFAV